MNKGRSSANHTPEPVRRRGRPLRSCDPCHARKIACDAAKPKCNWCLNQNLPCTYIRARQPVEKSTSSRCENFTIEPNIFMPSAKKSTSLAESLNFTIEPNIFMPSGNSPTPATGDIPAVKAQAVESWAPAFAQNLQFAGRHLGNICTFDGTPILSASGQEWIEACTGEELHMDLHPFNDAPRWLDYIVPQDDSSSQPRLPPNLPDLPYLHDRLAQYQSSIFGLFFPIIDPVLFEDTIKAAYFQQLSTASPSVNSARACVFAFVALVLVADISKEDGASLRHSIEYARYAHQLIPGIINEPTTLDGLQTMLLLCLCAQGIGGDYLAIDHLLSAASRCVYHLRANLSPHMAWGNSSPFHYHARMLFWITYVCDKGFSMITGLAPRLEDSQCDLNLVSVPEPPPEWPSNNKPLHVYGDPYPGSYLHIYIHLARIQSNIYRELYVHGALHRPDADLLRAMRNLDHALDEWKDSIPLENRPSFIPFSGNNSPGVVDMRFSIFHVQYHHCMLMIHQSSSRCTSWTGNQDTQNTSSSLAISVTACRSLLQTFLTRRLELGPSNLLFCLSYFIQAAINLFCKILSHPLNDGNQGDLYLIEEISHLIAKSQGPDDPLCYTAKTQFAERFILELKRLAQCAIDKAAREHNNVLMQ